MNSRELGKIGESYVISYLEKKGYTLIGRNVQVGHLEMDILMENETHLLMVEVKSRMATGKFDSYGSPASAVDGKKQKHLLDAAKAYLYEHPTEKQPRIDVAEVYLRKVGDEIVLAENGIHYIENALL